MIPQALKAFEERWANFLDIDLKTYENPIQKMSIVKRGTFSHCLGTPRKLF